MSGRLTDTSPEAEQVLREVHRRMPFERRWRRMGELYRTARLLHAAGERARHPAATRAQVHEAWLRMALGQELAMKIRERPMIPNDENLSVLQEVIGALSRLGIPYALGGSWASSLFGEPRLTYDADLAVEPFPGNEEAFCASFGPDYYVSLTAVRQAVGQRASFNVIYAPSGFKVDIFVRKDRPFDLSFMQRRRPHQLGDPPAAQVVELVSAEDVVLLKLEWYRIGNDSSEQQWKDILGVLKRQGEGLEQTYLDHWANELGVTDLLARARQESGT